MTSEEKELRVGSESNQEAPLKRDRESSVNVPVGGHAVKFVLKAGVLVFLPLAIFFGSMHFSEANKEAWDRTVQLAEENYKIDSARVGKSGKHQVLVVTVNGVDYKCGVTDHSILNKEKTMCTDFYMLEPKP